MEPQEERINTQTPVSKLPWPWQNPWFSVPVLLFFIGGLTVILIGAYGDDILFFNNYRETPLNQLFQLLTRFGEAGAFVVAVLVLLLFNYRYALLIALAGLLTLPISFALKDQIGRDRPITYFEKSGLRDQLVLVPGERLNSGQTSFPSGHTMAAFNLYCLLSVMVGRRKSLGLLAAFCAIGVALSRVFLVQHFTSDVLAGATVGLLIAHGILWIDRMVIARWHIPNKGLMHE